MSDTRNSGGRRRSNVHITKSGKEIKVRRNIAQRWAAHRDSVSRSKAKRLAGMPKDRFHRFLYRLQPKRLYHYWFSREGGIMALKILGISIVAGFVLLVGLFAYFRKDLPNITDISGNNIGGSVLYYDRTGQTLLWEDVNGVKRIPVQDENIAPAVKLATVAVEDKDFFHHGGFDLRGIARAGINDAFGNGSKQGGSTITQQLVRLTQKNVGTQQTITRKIKEVILAVEMERNYSKAQILTGYLNAAPYGGIEYGVEAASQNYFQKSAKDLTLDESAFLAAIPKAPSLYSPYSDYFDKQALVDRQHYILDLMVQQGMITAKERDDAKKVDTVAEVKPRPTYYAGIKAPYFVLAAQKELEAKYSTNVNRSGWKVITTLDLTLQDKAEQLVQKNIPNITNLTRGVADEEAMVAEDVQTGQIVALVGGTDFNNPDHGKINYAHDAFIPPGSSFKPYDYTTLIENHTNVTAGSVLYDQQGPLPGYPCTDHSAPPPKGSGNCLEDYDFLHPGPLTLRYALGGSRNIPAVKAMLSAVPNDTSSDHVASINKTISTASAMMDDQFTDKPYQCYQPGVDISKATQADVVQCYGASAIGDGAFLHLDDHVNGLATLARLGSAIPHTYILKITDASGKTVDEWKQPQGKQVVRQDSAYIVDNMASDGNASYLPGAYKFQSQPSGWKFAVKTGTTNNGFDGLMTSWSTKYAVVSWVGNHTRNKNLGGPGMEYLTTPLTRDWMVAAHANLKPVPWQQPSGVKSVPAFVVRNHVHYGDVEPSPSNDLAPSWYTGATKNTPQTIDIVSNKLATTCTPNLAKKTTGGSDSNAFSVDIFFGAGAVSSGGASATQNDDVHQCGDQPPSVTILDYDPSCNGSCNMTVSVNAGTHPLSDPNTYPQYPGTLNIIIGGQTVQSTQIDGPGNRALTFNYSGSGSQSVTVQVIDSVLYDSTSNAVTIDFGGGSTPLGLNGTRTNTNISFTWSGGTAPYTIYRNGSPLTGCSNVSSNSCSATVANTSASYYIRDTNGNQSDTTTL